MLRNTAVNKVQVIIRSIFATLIFLAYPYLVYRGMEKGIVWLAPAVISCIYIYQSVTAFNQRVKITKLAIALGLLLGAFFLQSLTAKLVPIFIQFMLMHFFGYTLIKGPPLVERFVRLDYPEFPPGIAEYCRQLTILWTAFFAFNIIICTALALWAPDLWWAIYNGILIYTFTGVLMVGEYIYRHFRFPDLDIPSPKSTIQSMISNGRNIWMDVNFRR